MNNNAIRIFFWILLTMAAICIMTACKKDEDPQPPEIRLIFDHGFTKDGDTLEIGRPIRFKVEADGPDANLTNFTVKKLYNGTNKTVLDSGLNSAGFSKTFTFYQSVEDMVEWQLGVMDRNRNEAFVSINVYKDPNSQFGGIYEFTNIRMGYQLNNSYGHFFLPLMNKVYFGDSASLYQDKVDILVYFNYREDLGVLQPSPTFSSPGEEVSGIGELYDDYYPFLKDWTIRNYTKYDIRAVNGITPELYNNAHHDSLLIVSYDDVWGKKKYKWAYPGTFIPIQTAAGKKGIIRVDQADNDEAGTITFSLKIQM
jgi:hypothetical protein